MVYNKILFCSDLYASSDYAFASALDLAERSGAELIILHVLESRHRYSGQFITADGEVWGDRETYGKLRSRLQEYYLSRIEQDVPHLVRVEVTGGVPWLEILRFARRERVDMIVMGPSTVQDPLTEDYSYEPEMGENARKVSAKAQCRVCVVSTPRHYLALDKVANLG